MIGLDIKEGNAPYKKFTGGIKKGNSMCKQQILKEKEENNVTF